jgi:glyoxylase-like metal-dependent hydrolase (beta-lactamase superfamily II)
MPEKNIIRLIVGSMATNCWIYPVGDGEAVIIDPGDEPDMILSALKKNSLTPKYILLTHGHFDHIGAVPLIKNNQDIMSQIAIHRDDSHYLGEEAYENHSLSIKAAMGNSAFIDAFWSDMPPPDCLLDEGSDIGPFTVLHLPGHTQGSVAFWDKEAGNLFTGDTLFKNGYGRTDLPGGNEKQLFESLKRLYAMDPAIKVYPGHGKTTTIKQESI